LNFNYISFLDLVNYTFSKIQRKDAKRKTIYNQLYNLRTHQEKLKSFSWWLSVLAVFAFRNNFYNEPLDIIIYNKQFNFELIVALLKQPLSTAFGSLGNSRQPKELLEL